MRPAPALHIGDVTSVPSRSHPRLRTDKRVDPTSAVCPVSGFALSRARMGEQNRDTPASAASNEIGTLWAPPRHHTPGFNTPKPPQNSENATPDSSRPCRNLCIQSDVLLERVTGIEPALSAWEAEVLPLNYTRAVIA